MRNDRHAKSEVANDPIERIRVQMSSLLFWTFLFHSLYLGRQSDTLI